MNYLLDESKPYIDGYFSAVDIFIILNQSDSKQVLSIAGQSLLYEPLTVTPDPTTVLALERRHNAFLRVSSRQSDCVFTIGRGAAGSLACSELGFKSSRGLLASALKSTELGRLALRSIGLSGARLGGLGSEVLGWAVKR